MFLPFVIDRMTVHRTGASAAVAHVRRVSDGDATVLDVVVADARGNVLVELAGLRARRFERARAPTGYDRRSAFERGVPCGLGGRRAARGLCRAPRSLRGCFASRDPVARAVAERVAAAGDTCTQTDWPHLGDALPAERVVCIWSNDGDAPDSALRAASEGLSRRAGAREQSRAAANGVGDDGGSVGDGGRGAFAVVVVVVGLGPDRDRRSIPSSVCEWSTWSGSLLKKPPTWCSASSLFRTMSRRWRGGAGSATSRSVVRAPEGAAPAPRTLRNDGTVLITGGLGALGLHVARGSWPRG